MIPRLLPHPKSTARPWLTSQAAVTDFLRLTPVSSFKSTPLPHRTSAKPHNPCATPRHICYPHASLNPINSTPISIP